MRPAYRTMTTTFLAVVLGLGTLGWMERDIAEARAAVAGQLYRLEWPYRNVYAQASVDYVQVASAGSGQAGGWIGIWNSNGSCAYVQFKASSGIWHHRSEKVCDRRLNRWVWYYWKDDFFLTNGGSYSFRTCVADWFRDSCGREYTIQILVS